MVHNYLYGSLVLGEGAEYILNFEGGVGGFKKEQYILGPCCGLLV